jgi:CBS domain-containing membrane protein
MAERNLDACVPVDISDDDIYEAMGKISGYLDITPGDFKELYLKAYEHALKRLTRSMKVAEVMTEDVASATPDTPMKDVAQLMALRKVSGVPVVTSDGMVTGVISEKDFLGAMGLGKTGTLMNVVADCLVGGRCLAAPIRAMTARDIMSAPAVTVHRDTPLMEVADTLTKRGINRLPVVDDSGLMVGIVSRADVVRSTLVGGDS